MNILSGKNTPMMDNADGPQKLLSSYSEIPSSTFLTFYFRLNTFSNLHEKITVLRYLFPCQTAGIARKVFLIKIPN